MGGPIADPLAPFGVDPYRPHPLHLDSGNEWPDANCYTDLWIELLHGLGLDPMPMLAFTLGIRYEADQWTFFKPPPEDLRGLYGIEVFELAVYRPLDQHVVTHLAGGRVAVLEVDAYHLPDVAQTYRTTHTKTTVAVVGVDRNARTARYLHNGGAHDLAAADYAGIFRTGGQGAVAGQLAPYLEAADISGVVRRSTARLVAAARANLHRHAERRCETIAIDQFVEHFAGQLGSMSADEYDGYAFATLRQLGSASALSARFCRWLAHAAEGVTHDAGAAGPGQGRELRDIADDLEIVSRCAKRLILKGARTVATRRPPHLDDVQAELTSAWSSVAGRLREVGEAGH